ncbi:MAG: homocysteine S-methyltransferase family protein [Pseudomonadota bacterium]
MSVPAGVTLIDGGLGTLLRLAAPEEDRRLWPAEVLFEAPETVVAAHRTYLKAGAQAITTNSYALADQRMETLLGRGADWEEALTRAGALARQAAGAALVLGSLPPLAGSYRPDLVGAYDQILATYNEHVRVLGPHVDILLCETMTTAEEARAAATAAQAAGKPVWVSWTLEEAPPARLRSGESLGAAWAALEGLEIDAVLVNCTSPEAVADAMPVLARFGPRFGGYANAFSAVPKGWRLADGVAALGKRRDLTPEVYADHALAWVAAGASIIGGCCETGPEHIAELARRLETPA